MSESKIKLLQEKSLPRLASQQDLSLDEACNKGNTSRAHAILGFLRTADDLPAKAQKNVKTLSLEVMGILP
jgi:hypothetical protein